MPAIPFIVLMDVITNLPNLIAIPDGIICLLSAIIAEACSRETGPNTEARTCGFRQAACALAVLSASGLTDPQVGVWFDEQLRYFRTFRKTGRNPNANNVMTAAWLTKRHSTRVSANSFSPTASRRQ